MSDGCVYVVQKQAFYCSMIRGVFTTYERAKASIEQCDDKEDWLSLTIHRIPLDHDYDEWATDPVYEVSMEVA